MILLVYNIILNNSIEKKIFLKFNTNHYIIHTRFILVLRHRKHAQAITRNPSPFANPGYDPILKQFNN